MESFITDFDPMKFFFIKNGYTSLENIFVVRRKISHVEKYYYFLKEMNTLSIKSLISNIIKHNIIFDIIPKAIAVSTSQTI